MQTDFQLGQRVRDEISGFEGIVTAISEHITGCTRVEVSADDTDDPTREGESNFFYEVQLEPADGDGFTDIETTETSDLTLGQRVTDDVTGFEGDVTTITYELYNCPRIGVQATPDDSEERGEKEWFDEPRLTIVGEGVSADFEAMGNKSVAATGAPREDIRRRTDRA